MKKSISLLLTALWLISCNQTEKTDDELRLNVPRALQAPVIDGKPDDACWQNSPWHLINQLWVGKLPHASDYMGKFKLAWDQNHLYILAEIYDDSLVDTHPDNPDLLWAQDGLEIYLAPDSSAADQATGQSAFEYHLSPGGQIVAHGADSLFHFFNNHATLRTERSGKISTWEIALNLYPGSYPDSAGTVPLVLNKGNTWRFMIAYMDNDGGPQPENLLGNIHLRENPDRDWTRIDARDFGKIVLE